MTVPALRDYLAEIALQSIFANSFFVSTAEHVSQ
jgi:hypothetical protein